jgi:hypothetical protein
MSETNYKKVYLDFDGLKKYDKLIKSYIALSNKSLVTDVANLVSDVDALKTIDHEAYKSADITLEESLKGYIDEKADLKQDKIDDLDTIRLGAAAGASVAAASDDDIDNLFK